MRRARGGFTLIEILIVVVIIGILARLGIARYRLVKEKAYRTAMISDLRNLVGIQEGYMSVANDYAGGITTGAQVVAPGSAGRISFVASKGNTIALRYRTTAANGPGWSATVRNPKVTTKAYDICGIFVGHTSYAPNTAVKQSGSPKCY